MTPTIHPAAAHHQPFFITSPGQTDVLIVVTAIILLVAFLMFGSFFFRLHTMPERMAHRSKKFQFEIVAVLGLISLFTHNHIFWIAGLLLALIDIPDFGGSLSRIAGSTEKLAGFGPGEGAVDVPPQPDVPKLDVAQPDVATVSEPAPPIAPAPVLSGARS